MSDASATQAEVLETERLELVPGTGAMLRADLAGPAALADALGADVPASWPPDLYDEPAIRFTLNALEAHPDYAAWGFHYFVLRPGAEGARTRTVVGVGGFKGPPLDGTVEIGYSIVPEFRRRGLATEAVRAFIDRSFADPRVRRVIAETLPELRPSIGVLEKVGMRQIGPGSEPGVIRFEILRGEEEDK